MGGDTLIAEGVDLFDCLLKVRREIEKTGLRLCCQGARRDVFPSGMSRQMSGERIAYELGGGATPDHRVVDIFDPADCELVSSVGEHLSWVEKHYAGRRENARQHQA